MIPTHMVVQFLIANGCVKEEELEAFLQKISSSNSTSQQNADKIYQLVLQINKKIGKYNLMIRRAVDDITTIRYYVLISTVDSAITREASQYTPKQYEFFKFTLRAIVDEPRGIITESTLKEMAEKAGVALVGKSRTCLPEYKMMYNEWVDQKWLHVVIEGDSEYITLGVRSMAELDVHIKTNLLENTDDLDCQNCKALSIYSVNCSRCEARYHKRCSKMSIDPETGICRSCPDYAPIIQERPTRTRKSIKRDSE